MRGASRAIVAIASILPLSCAANDFKSGPPPTSSGGAGTGGTSGDGLGGSTGSGGSATAGFPSVGGSSGTAGTSEGGAATGGTSGNSPTGGSTGTSGESGNSGEGGEGGTPGCDSAKSPTEEVCLVSDDAAVFASPAGSDNGDGTKAHPLKTLNKAVLVAHAASKLVLACSTHGAFSEQLTLDGSVDGARLYGGFDCETWQYDATKKTELSSTQTTALRIDGLDVGATLEDVAFTAADGSGAGESSLGALITSSKNVRLARVSLTAGKGMDGMSGSGMSTPAKTGAAGQNGGDACMAQTQPNPGGASVETQCEGIPSGSIGGKGGDGGNDANSAGSGNPGSPELGGGASGAGESNSGWTCGAGNGQPGNPGTTQAPAAGAATLGTLTPAGWSGTSGGSGENGTPGQGGGGGGGAKAPDSCGSLPLTGASGGSGGGGGCGGKGGTGGQAGGSSIALAVLDSTVTLSEVALVSTDAGKGGDGGKGQPGGSGGDAGKAAHGGVAADSCPGGQGGKGGNGGAGGGAAGGISVGILWSGDAAPSYDASTTFSLGTPGAKGIGGVPGSNDGIVGVAQNELPAP